MLTVFIDGYDELKPAELASAVANAVGLALGPDALLMEIDGEDWVYDPHAATQVTLRVPPCARHAWHSDDNRCVTCGISKTEAKRNGRKRLR